MMDTMDRVQATWDELEFKVKPVRYWCFVRTEHLPQKTANGVIWMPSKLTNFFGELPHMQVIKGLICATGPQVFKKYGLKVGERVVFKRLEFAWFKKMEDGTYFGWINPSHIMGYTEDDEEYDAKVMASRPIGIREPTPEPMPHNPDYGF